MYLYAEVLQDSRVVYFYFESSSKNKLIYSHNIPVEFNVGESIYWELHRELTECFEELHELFRVNTPQSWTNLTMYIDFTGKFNMDYDYYSISSSGLSPSQQQTIWKYKVLGIYPTDERRKKLVDDYIKNKHTTQE